MADKPDIHIGENSPEKIAYELMQKIAEAEKKTFAPHMVGSDDKTLADRKWIISTYVECIRAVKSHYSAY